MWERIFFFLKVIFPFAHAEGWTKLFQIILHFLLYEIRQFLTYLIPSPYCIITDFYYVLSCFKGISSLFKDK